MGRGTPCDLKSNEPRSVVIKYICDQESYKYGTVSIPKEQIMLVAISEIN